MFERELEQEEKTPAAERARSPSDAASVGGPADAPTPALAVHHPEVISPAVQADPSPAVPPVSEPPSSDMIEEAQAADALLDEEPFPEEPFEEMRRPRLVGVGKSKGRRLVKPEETPQPSMTPEQRLLIFDTWQRSGLPAGDFATLVGKTKRKTKRTGAYIDEDGMSW